MTKPLTLGEAIESWLSVRGTCPAAHEFDIELEKLLDLRGRHGRLEDAIVHFAFCPECGSLARAFKISTIRQDPEGGSGV